MTSTWFITGIGRGLGRCIAEEVLRRGGRVAGTVRRMADADGLREMYPGLVWAAELDLSDLAKIAGVFGQAVSEVGRVDVAVNNAGYSLLGAAEELSLGEMRHILDTNLVGSIEVARAAVAHMRQAGGGRLIQISSGAGQAGFAGLSLYCASKWGIEGFFEALAQEVAGFGIQTTLVEPGAIRTGFGSSGVLSAELEAYREGPVGMMRGLAKGGYVAQGDPVKMARAIVDAAAAERAPARLALGPDVHGYIQGALEARMAQLEEWKAVTMSTDCDDAASM